MSTVERSRRWRLAHPEYRYVRKPFTPEQIARRKLTAKRWRRRNKEQLLAYGMKNRRRRNAQRRAWYARNKPKDQAHVLRWKAANKEHVLAYNRAYKKRRVVKLAWNKWTSQCAQSRLGEAHAP